MRRNLPDIERYYKEKYGKVAINVGDEGGFAPPLTSLEPIKLILDAIKQAGYSGKIKLGLDSAASNFYDKEKTSMLWGNNYAPMALVDKYKRAGKKKYPIISYEDPFAEDDFENFSVLTKRLERMSIGDDLLVTNVERLKRQLV